MKIKEVFHDKLVVGSPIKHYIKLVILLMIIWVLLSGKMEAKFLLHGVATALVSGLVCMPLLLVHSTGNDKKYFIFDFSVFRFIKYCGWLFVQLVLANIDIAKAVIKPELGIDPQILRFKVNMDNPTALTVLANSITLTPGTVTMNVTEDGIYEIHALTQVAADGIIAGGMQREVAKLFKQDGEFTMLEEDALV